MPTNDCETIIFHILFAVSNQTLLTIRVKSRLIVESISFIIPAHPIRNSHFPLLSQGVCPACMIKEYRNADVLSSIIFDYFAEPVEIVGMTRWFCRKIIVIDATIQDTGCAKIG